MAEGIKKIFLLFQYLKFLADQANDKMETNQMKIKHFFIILKETLGDNKKSINEK